MKIAILISGLLRSFNINYNKIVSYFSEHEIEIFICTSKYTNADEKYLTLNDDKNNVGIGIGLLPFVKDILYVDDNIPCIDGEYNNLTKQWYKFNKLSRLLELFGANYDLIVKIRPDIHILDDNFNYENIMTGENIINIPIGYDIFNSELFGNYDSINDQMAIFTPDMLYVIAGFYDYLKYWCFLKEEELPPISEILFKKYLDVSNIKINRFPLNYKLILSPCNIIAICGDSGSGKSTLCRLIEPILPKSEKLVLETDRYHKWERGDDNYKSFTHLNPYANHLEKMSEDVYRLKICDNIYTVDYDHKTGKFTPIENIEAKTNVILCGLHTLYIDKVQNLLNLKIFMDTDRELIKHWKIKRDVEQRGHNLEKVLDSIRNREPDYYKYIDIQKQNADVIIRFYLDSANRGDSEDKWDYDDLGNYDNVKSNIFLMISIRYELIEKIKYILEKKDYYNMNVDEKYIKIEYKNKIIQDYNNIISNYFELLLN